MTLPFENDTSRIVKRLAKQNMKANRRTSISIMVAILIASTFLCSLCTFVQSYWNQSVQQEIAAYGDWDGGICLYHSGRFFYFCETQGKGAGNLKIHWNDSKADPHDDRI